MRKDLEDKAAKQKNIASNILSFVTKSPTSFLSKISMFSGVKKKRVVHRKIDVDTKNEDCFIIIIK